MCWVYARGLAVLCLKASCKYKASSTCFCYSSHTAFPCSATTMSSWDTVTGSLQAPKDTRCPCGMPGLRSQRGWNREQQHCWSRVLLICCPQHHPRQPQPCLLPKIHSWLSCDCSGVTAPARGAASRHSPLSHGATWGALTQRHWLRGWPWPCSVCLVQLPKIAGTLSSGLASVGPDSHGMAGTCPWSALLCFSSDSPLIGAGRGSVVWGGMPAWDVGTGCDNPPHTLPCSRWEQPPPLCQSCCNQSHSSPFQVSLKNGQGEYYSP